MSKDCRQKTVPIGNVPNLILSFANSGKKYRPSRQATAISSDPFTNLETAQDFLQLWGISEQVSEVDLRQIQNLRKSLQIFIEGLEKQDDYHTRNALETLNKFAAQCHWIYQLGNTGTLIKTISGPIAATIAALCVSELSDAEFSRLKTCCWPPCKLVFYDSTRNHSAKWHAEDPCGWRARAARYQSSKKNKKTE